VVCDEHFSDTDAKVVCRQLGYPTSEAVSRNTVYRSGSGTVWLGQVNCSGSEYALEACHHSSWETVQCCCHSEVVGVQCSKIFNTSYLLYDITILLLMFHFLT
jgi:deleted-in-malignant-brain-tumors protein 1